MAIMTEDEFTHYMGLDFNGLIMQLILSYSITKIKKISKIK